MNGNEEVTETIAEAVERAEAAMMRAGLSATEATAAMERLRERYEDGRERKVSDPTSGTEARKLRRMNERATAKAARKALQ
jgi:hypothetical protein